MKKGLRFSKLALVAIMVVCMLTLTACTAVQVSTAIELKEDGTGSRTITASIAKNDDNQDGYGSAYYFFKKHGNELATYLKAAYKEAVPGSEDWLSISVNDSDADWEVIKLTFEFKSFDDYKTKLAALAYDTTAAATYVAPELTVNDNGTATYTENPAALTAIYKSLQTTFMKDDTIFDFNATKNGTATNNGAADLQSLTDYGVEFMKVENGTAVTIQLGSDQATAVEAVEGIYTLTGNYVAITAEEEAETSAEDAEEEKTASDNEAAAETTAENTSEDTSSVVDNSLPKTGESIVLAVVLFLCLAGCATIFIASKKLSKNNQ